MHGDECIWKERVAHPAHHLGHHIDHKQGKQCHPMRPAQLSRYGHEGEIEPRCGQCVWAWLGEHTPD
eukprot:1160534-Pelagomonas_calceolata.AAC.1